MESRSSIVAIFRDLVGRYPRHFAVLCLVLVAQGVVAVAAVLGLVPLADYMLDPGLKSPSRITRAVLDLLSPLHLQPSLWLFGLLFVLSMLVKALLDIATRYWILRIKYAVMRGLLRDALTTFFKARWEFFAQEGHGRLLNTLNGELTIIGDTLGSLATQLGNLVQLCIYLIVPLWLNPIVTMTALGLAIVVGSPLLLLQTLSYRWGKKNTETANVCMAVMSELFAVARLVLGFGRQKEAETRFLHTFDHHVHFTLRSQTLTAAVGLLYQPAGILAAIIALGVGLRRGGPVAEMAALLWSLLRALPLLAELMAANVSIKGFLPSYEQLLALCRQAAAVQEVEGDRIFRRLETGIVLRDVAFSYPGRERALRGVDLTIRKGEMTALVGESGSGKSTITDLVLGLQIPERGVVLLDGVPLAQWKQNSFRERIGYVPQDPVLFHASIRDNLLWAQPGASDAEMWEACRMANAEAFIRLLSDGIDTIVGDRGLRLSGGQRQRIALARALLRQPELLILDEATSSLDSESERLIQESVNRVAENATILVVAHRLSTIAGADQVYLLRDGTVVEEGRYGDLTAKPGGLLAGMIAAQRGT